ncbi:MAG: YbaN family protein [Gammaproteobacteria bacterium]|nr:YbaN family protein [Gammaproteobacteria bacterium]
MRRPQLFIYRVLGLLFLGAGTLGIFVPLLPTVPLWILAAFLFTRSSPALQKKIYAHPQFGETVKEFVEDGVLSRQNKRFAIAGASVSSLISLALIQPPPYIVWTVVMIMIAVVVWLATRPESLITDEE